MASQADQELTDGRWASDMQQAFRTSELFRKIARAAAEAAQETELQSGGFPNLTVGKLAEILQRMDPNLGVTFPDGRVPEPHLVSYQGYHGHVALPAWNRTHTSASQLRWALRKSMEGSTRRSHHGDIFRIGPDTPLWAGGINRETRDAVTGVEARKDRLVLTTQRVDPQDKEEQQPKCSKY